MADRGRLSDCIFCGDTGVERAQEDVFPLWLCRKLAYYAEQHHPGKQPSFVNYTYDNLASFQNDDMSGSGATERAATGRLPAAYKIPDVCTECNGGWMGRLEQGAGLLIPGLMEGKPKRIATYDQFTLSTWAVKTCLTYDAAREPRSISERFGSRQLFVSGYPLPGSHVVIGHDPELVPDGSLLHGRKRLGADASKALDFEAVRFGFQFEHLIIFVIINYGDDLERKTDHLAANPLTSPHFQQIWPPVGLIRSWPTDAARASTGSAQ